MLPGFLDMLGDHSWYHLVWLDNAPWCTLLLLTALQKGLTGRLPTLWLLFWVQANTEQLECGAARIPELCLSAAQAVAPTARLEGGPAQMADNHCQQLQLVLAPAGALLGLCFMHPSQSKQCMQQYIVLHLQVRTSLLCTCLLNCCKSSITEVPLHFKIPNLLMLHMQ